MSRTLLFLLYTTHLLIILTFYQFTHAQKIVEYNDKGRYEVAYSYYKDSLDAYRSNENLLKNSTNVTKHHYIGIMGMSRYLDKLVFKGKVSNLEPIYLKYEERKVVLKKGTCICNGFADEVKTQSLWESVFRFPRIKPVYKKVDVVVLIKKSVPIIKKESNIIKPHYSEMVLIKPKSVASSYTYNYEEDTPDRIFVDDAIKIYQYVNSYTAQGLPRFNKKTRSYEVIPSGYSHIGNEWVDIK